MKRVGLRIAMLSLHSSPIGELGTRDTGGMSVYIRELARELGRRGHRVDIYTRLFASTYRPSTELYKNVRLVHLQAGTNAHLSKLDLYPYIADFFRDLERCRSGAGIRYDLIHSHYWLSGLLGNRARDSWGVPHLVMFHTLGAAKNNAGQAEPEPGLRIASEGHLTKACQRILAATEREKRQLIRYYGASPEKIGVVPCGVNLDLFRPLDRRTAREGLGFDNDESIVLYVGRLAPLKGIERLMAAMTYLGHRRVRLVIVGGNGHRTPEAGDLARLASRWGIGQAVTLVGSVRHENLRPYYSAADVLAVPSYYESFGLVALESLASGTPVVATRVGAMETIIQEGETGLVVRDGSPRELAKGIETFISCSRPPSAEAIRASVLGFAWPTVASGVVGEYARVLGQYHAAAHSSQRLWRPPCRLIAAHT